MEGFEKKLKQSNRLINLNIVWELQNLHKKYSYVFSVGLLRETAKPYVAIVKIVLM